MKTNIKKQINCIFHVDADAFFVSCEQSLNAVLRNKPVVVGKEHGVVVALSYEAKNLGVKRGMSIYEIKRNYPHVIILSGNYEAYSLFSKRLFSILRRYTHMVEEYGIDEAFVDISGMDKVLKKEYLDIAKEIQCVVERELGITVSIGLGQTKSLAKIASNYKKPKNITKVSMSHLGEFLQNISIEKIWGVGPSTTHYMNQLGIYTAWSFVQKSEQYIKNNFAKPHQEIWRELRGEQVYKICNEIKTSYASISKTHTFSRGISKNKGMIYAELVNNMEHACSKSRIYSLAAKKIRIFLKRKNFSIDSVELCLTRSTAYPHDIMKCIHEAFDTIFVSGVEYRATGIVLSGLEDIHTVQLDLFEKKDTIEKFSKIYGVVDMLAKKFGQHTLHIGSSLKVHAKKQYKKIPQMIYKKQCNMPVFFC
jgi:DNA polymerase IV